MAAIDKMYIHSYLEYDALRRWSLLYYPKLILLYSPSCDMTYSDYKAKRAVWVANANEVRHKDYKRFYGPKSPEQNLIDYYKRTADYDCPPKQAEEEWKYCEAQMKKSIVELEDDYTFLALSTPMEVDRKLKWICPCPCVRRYLHKQCGVNPKLEWLYRIFWKGKKYFDL